MFILATAFDLIFQYLAFNDVRLLAAIVVAALLAVFPYMLLRGPLNRLFRRKKI